MGSLLPSAATRSDAPGFSSADRLRQLPLFVIDKRQGLAIELMLLGNAATLVGKPLEFDALACKIADNEEADAALRPKHRQGWEV